jgi:hypothetical protein
MNKKLEVALLVIVVIVVAILMLMLAFSYGDASAQDEFDPPPPNPLCRNGWSIMWVLEESKYCSRVGTYVLFHCFDYNNCDHYFKARCYYDDAEPVPVPVIHQYFLPLVQKPCTPPAFWYEGDCVIIGDPFP